MYRAGDFSNESFALIIALLMPATVDWYVVIMAVLAGVLIGKEVFWRLRQLSLQPRCCGYAVAAVSWPEQVFRYPQPYINIPLWDATGVPVSSTISDTLRSGGSLNIGAISLVLGEYAAPHWHGCRPHPSGLRAFPLAAKGCPSGRFCQLCGHLCPHRLPLPPVRWE